MKFQILVFDGFDEMDVFGVFEALRMADFTVQFASLEEQSQTVGSYGARIIPDVTFDPDKHPDILIVPGGGWITNATKGARAEASKGRILTLLKTVHTAGSVLASVCAGSMLLGKAGLLSGRPATTNLALLQELRETGANVIESRVVDDGNIITAGGITSSLDLGLWLIERFADAATAAEVSRKLEFEPRGPVWKR